MQAAKKLVLVDEFDKEYKRLQRPATAVAKTDHSIRVSNTLRNAFLTDDRKVREYVGALQRYLNVNNQSPVNQTGALNLQDLKMADQIAGLENAGPGK